MNKQFFGFGTLTLSMGIQVQIPTGSATVNLVMRFFTASFTPSFRFRHSNESGRDNRFSGGRRKTPFLAVSYGGESRDLYGFADLDIGRAILEHFPHLGFVAVCQSMPYHDLFIFRLFSPPQSIVVLCVTTRRTEHVLDFLCPTRAAMDRISAFGASHVWNTPFPCRALYGTVITLTLAQPDLSYDALL